MSDPVSNPSLPDGLTSRPLGLADARAVYELMAADQLAHLGQVEIEEADIVGDWQRPSFDVTAQTVGVFDGDRLVGYAEAGVRGDAAVHPELLGRGIGTWLAHRMQELGRALGLSMVSMPIPSGSPGDRLLEALGYHVRWTSWVLKLPEGAEIVARPLPTGYVVREAAQDEAERRVAHGVLEDAFLEWSDRDREDYADFAAGVLGRPGFEPWNLRVVTDADGRVAGVAVVLVSTEEMCPRPISPGWPPGPTSATADWPRHCWWTRSPLLVHTGHAGVACPPTTAPVRWGSTRRWA